MPAVERTWNMGCWIEVDLNNSKWSGMSWMAMVAVLGLASVHVFAGKLRFLEGTPRSGWLSVAGGISVAYVFLYLLPELAAGQRSIKEADARFLSFFQHHTYAAALVGLIAFYGSERASKTTRQRRGQNVLRDEHGRRVFWTHMVLLSFYNTMVGYLLAKDSDSLRDLAFFFVAMALHLLVMDRGLRDHYQHLYHGQGRWFLSAALLVGWGVGTTVGVPEPAISLFIAFVAGGIILNVLKEELPEQRQSRFGAFMLGAVLYSALLLGYA
jgi:hypothetical protein